jgi:hypothetical protein
MPKVANKWRSKNSSMSQHRTVTLILPVLRRPGLDHLERRGIGPNILARNTGKMKNHGNFTEAV